MALPNLTTIYPGSGTPTDYCNAIPQMPLAYPTRYDGELTLFEDDASQFRKTSNTKHREYTLVYATQSDSERASFEAFMAERWADGNPFYFNDVRNAVNDIKVRVKDWNFKYSADSVRTNAWTVTVVTVLS